MWRSKGQAEAPTCLEKYKKWATYQTAELPQNRERLLINNWELWWRMKSWVLAFLNWSWGWHIKRKCQTDRLRFHLDISRCVWNRETDLRLVHIKTVINFVLRDESGTRERKPQADCSARLKMWAHAFLPCFHAHVIMCALSHHFFKWFLILTQKSDFPQPWAFRGILQYKNMILTIAHIFRQTRSISVWGIYRVTDICIKSELCIKYCMQVRNIVYDTLGREKWSLTAIPYWQTWRLKLLTFLFTDQICNMTWKLSLEPAKRASSWFRWQRVIFSTQDFVHGI